MQRQRALRWLFGGLAVMLVALIGRFYDFETMACDLFGCYGVGHAVTKTIFFDGVGVVVGGLIALWGGYRLLSAKD